MSEWKMVPKKIGYRERLAFEVVIGRVLSAEEGQRLWDAMLATGPDQWQPIDTCPKDGTAFLAYLPDRDRGYVARQDVQSVFWLSERFIFTGSGHELTTDRPTHWMPLPLGPAKERRGGLSRAPEAS